MAITGRSGSGKSTLLGILATLDQASGGELMVCGEVNCRIQRRTACTSSFKAYWFCVPVISVVAAFDGTGKCDVATTVSGKI